MVQLEWYERPVDGLYIYNKVNTRVEKESVVSKNNYLHMPSYKFLDSFSSYK